MAALTATNPTLLDLAKRLDPDDKIATVIEILNTTNEILPDMTWIEGNLPTGHLTTLRTGIPQPTWRKLNQGVQPTKSTTAQVTYGTGMMEAYAEIDKALADLNGNEPAWRLSEERPHIEGLNQELAGTLFYGNETTEPEAFTGLTPYYNSATDESADNIIDGGGSGTDNASIWMVVWGPNTVHGIYPKGSKAGLQMTDKGQITIEDASGGSNTGRMEAYRSHYRWDVGLAVRDWRYVVRIPNIDKSALVINAATGANLSDLMFQALRLPPTLTLGRPAFYMSRDIMTWLFRQTSAATSSSTLRTENVGGTIITTFHGVPLRRCDALSADESAVTGL